MAMGWTAIIMRDGLKTPAEVIITMQNHLRDFGGYFIILDLLVFGLLIRWIHLARKPKALINVWIEIVRVTYSNHRRLSIW